MPQSRTSYTVRCDSSTTLRPGMLRPERTRASVGLWSTSTAFPLTPSLSSMPRRIFVLGASTGKPSTTLSEPSWARWERAERRAAARAFFGMSYE